MFRRSGSGNLQVFLVHPGGPFFGRKDEGAWSIPKGLIEGKEDPLGTALREFEEEVGFRPAGDMLELGSIRQKGGKIVHAWAFEIAPGKEVTVRSNSFEMEWPPGSGKVEKFPEVDRGGFFDLKVARKKINAAQAAFIDRLLEKLKMT